MELKTVKIYNQRVECEIMVDFLKSNGISAVLLGDDVGAMRMHLGMQTGYRLQVFEKDLEEVTKLIAATENQESEE